MLKPKILLIDDEDKIHDFISISLAAENLEYIGSYTATSGLSLFNQEKPSLIILDLGLPDLDGRAVLKKVRETSDIPVLVLTARDQEAEKVRLLDAGANDYLSKPFGIRELISRIKVLLRDIKYEAMPSELRFDKLIIKTGEPLVLKGQKAVQLTKKEHQLLVKLAIHPNVLVNQKKLLVDIWGASHADDVHYLRVLITQLRKKLGDDAEDPYFIKTEPGLGYRFIGD
ncbi:MULTISPECIES: response regulator [Alteromonadaceae]|uniref:response regulator n=1 Tax=Alteromonadaceae TaxID=72275 RepID=UPI001C097411|nr:MULTISPECIES: response regulator transcription factor [Aliiglaciecola]MBU2877088.1 response regulator transcription factor [Aliiglaciecola lipolytica]MDO6710193.1 response regulator transcription factor [Aliiglaciecola sp. 2_MG-2023]MDO6751341.1 response regulator transcription factor [Aliiglaciecola sp. 1_MG-2023]